MPTPEKNEDREESDITSGLPWMPLGGTVEQWGAFGGTHVTYAALAAASQAPTAFSFGANALSRFNEACHARLNGAEITARAAFGRVIEDLQHATSRWMRVMYWSARPASEKSRTRFAHEHIPTRLSRATQQLAPPWCSLTTNASSLRPVLSATRDAYRCSRVRREHMTERIQRTRRIVVEGDGNPEEDAALYTTRLAKSARRRTAAEPSRPAIQRSSRDMHVHAGDQRAEVAPSRGSHAQHPPLRQAAEAESMRERRLLPSPPRRIRWLFPAGIGTSVVLLVWILGGMMLSRCHGKQGDPAYGPPPTFEINAVVGHNDMHTPSRFLAINLHSQVYAIECPGGNRTKAIVSVGPGLNAKRGLARAKLDLADVRWEGGHAPTCPQSNLSIHQHGKQVSPRTTRRSCSPVVQCRASSSPTTRSPIAEVRDGKECKMLLSPSLPCLSASYRLSPVFVPSLSRVRLLRLSCDETLAAYSCRLRTEGKRCYRQDITNRHVDCFAGYCTD